MAQDHRAEATLPGAWQPAVHRPLGLGHLEGGSEAGPSVLEKYHSRSSC